MTTNGKATVHMALLLDESGSMAGMEQGVIDGTNEFIGSLRDEQATDEVRVSLAMFDLNAIDDRVRVKWDGKLLADVPMLRPGDYRPRGSTPLNDAVVETIDRVSRQMAENDRAMLVVYTDGLENASETKFQQVKDLVEQKTNEGWVFIYLGAKQDQWAGQDAKVGMAAVGQTFSTTTTSKGTRSAISTAGELASAYAGRPEDYQALATTRPKEIAEDEADQRKSSSTADNVSTARRHLRGKS